MNYFFLPTLAKTINAYLALDQESHRRLKKLQNKAINIELLPFHRTLHCSFNEQGITIQKAEEGEITHATLRGTPLQFAAVMLAKESRPQFFADDLTIEGDAELAQSMVELLEKVEIDWEEYLSLIVGDVPAFHLSRSLKNLKSWLTNSRERFAEDVSEYVHEEARWLPQREALQDFFSDIDTLAMDVERAALRVQKLYTDLEK